MPRYKSRGGDGGAGGGGGGSGGEGGRSGGGDGEGGALGAPLPGGKKDTAIVRVDVSTSHYSIAALQRYNFISSAVRD